jgi:hypothetical protein
MLSDLVYVNDAGRITLRGSRETLERAWGEEASVIEVKGWVRTLCRERGKIVPGSRREGHNIWTNTGREFLAMLMTYMPGGQTPYRNDRMAYLGVGIGLQTEDSSVTGLVHPVPFVSGLFLAPLDHDATNFPLSPTRTTVRYIRVFSEDQVTFGESTSVLVSELGLFTDGNPANGFQVGPPPTGRLTDIDSATLQAPCAYKGLVEPVEKTNALEFQVEWEIRF